MSFPKPILTIVALKKGSVHGGGEKEIWGRKEVFPTMTEKNLWVGKGRFSRRGILTEVLPKNSPATEVDRKKKRSTPERIPAYIGEEDWKGSPGKIHLSS